MMEWGLSGTVNSSVVVALAATWERGWDAVTSGEKCELPEAAELIPLGFYKNGIVWEGENSARGS